MRRPPLELPLDPPLLADPLDELPLDEDIPLLLEELLLDLLMLLLLELDRLMVDCPLFDEVPLRMVVLFLDEVFPFLVTDPPLRIASIALDLLLEVELYLLLFDVAEPLRETELVYLLFTTPLLFL